MNDAETKKRRTESMSDTNNHRKGRPGPAGIPSGAGTETLPLTPGRSVKRVTFTTLDAHQVRAECGGFTATLVRDLQDDEGRRWPDIVYLVSGVFNVLRLYGRDNLTLTQAVDLEDSLARGLELAALAHGHWDDFCEHLDHLAHVLRAVIAEAFTAAREAETLSQGLTP
jgi:hypothetical protein